MKKQFSSYALIGVLNTAIHWMVFLILYSLDLSQAKANLFSFFMASVFSYIVNSKITFKEKLNLFRYLIFFLGMALISWSVGKASDIYQLNPLVTLIVFSFVSLILGFLWSKFVVFKTRINKRSENTFN